MKPSSIAPLLLLLPLALQPLRAEAVRLVFEPARTRVAFTLDATLHKVNGTFAFKRGVIDYDTATGKASGELIIDASSGRSGNDGRDEKMHKTVLESAKYPEIKFVPARVEGQAPAAGAESEVKLHGQFLLHGATHALTMTARVRKEAGGLKTTAAFQIPYVQWGLKNPSNFLLKVSDKVEIRIEAEAALSEK